MHYRLPPKFPPWPPFLDVLLWLLPLLPPLLTDLRVPMFLFTDGLFFKVFGVKMLLGFLVCVPGAGLFTVIVLQPAPDLPGRAVVRVLLSRFILTPSRLPFML